MAALLPPSRSMLRLRRSQQHATEHSHLLLHHDSDTMSKATCSVIRRVPWTDPGGCDCIARYMGPPPRPTVPPRPWNSVSLTSNSLHTYACIQKQSAINLHSQPVQQHSSMHQAAQTDSLCPCIARHLVCLEHARSERVLVLEQSRNPLDAS